MIIQRLKRQKDKVRFKIYKVLKEIRIEKSSVIYEEKVAQASPSDDLA